MAAKQNASILGEAKPSKAIIKLALPATLPCWPKQFTTLWIPPISEC